MKSNKKIIYDTNWRKAKVNEGWKFISWLLPPEFVAPLTIHKKYLMNGRRKRNNGLNKIIVF
jgi:hypothetical protein